MLWLVRVLTGACLRRRRCGETVSEVPGLDGLPGQCQRALALS